MGNVLRTFLVLFALIMGRESVTDGWNIMKHSESDDITPPAISTDIFGDYGCEVMFDNRGNITVNATDEESGMALLCICPSYSQNEYISDTITPSISEGEFVINYNYPKGDEYGYVITAMDKAGNVSTRVIITRYNVTSKMKRIIPRGNYD